MNDLWSLLDATELAIRRSDATAIFTRRDDMTARRDRNHHETWRQTALRDRHHHETWRHDCATRPTSSRDVTTWLRHATNIIMRRDNMTAPRDQHHHETWRHDCATRPKSSRDVTTWLWCATEIITRRDETGTRGTGLRQQRRHRNDDSPRRRTTATQCERHACATRRDVDGTWNDFATTTRTYHRTDECSTAVRICSGNKLAAVTPQRRSVGPHQSRHVMIFITSSLVHSQDDSKETFAMNIRSLKEDVRSKLSLVNSPDGSFATWTFVRCIRRWVHHKNCVTQEADDQK